MAVKTYRVGSAASVDGNFGALFEADAGALTRTDGWTVAKLAATNQAEFAVNIKQTSAAFAIAAKPASFLTGAGCNAFKTPSPGITGTFAAAAWTFTFAVRAGTASAQAGRIRLRVFKSANANGSGATELTGATLVGTTTAALSTTVDVESAVTWSPGAITLNNEYLFFVVAWEITTASGSNSGDVQLRQGQVGAGTRFLTPNFVAVLAAAPTGLASAGAFGTVNILEGPVSRTVSGIASAQAFGALGFVTTGPPQTVVVVGLGPTASGPPLVDTFVVNDGTVVDGSAGISGVFGVPVVAITLPSTNVPVSGVATAQSFGVPTIRTAVSKPAGGVPTAQAFGTPTIKGAITRTVGAVSSAQTFGSVTLAQTGGPQTAAVSGKTSAQAFGSLAFRVTLGSGGVLSAQAFGTPTPKAVITRTVTGLGSAQSFGAITPKATITRQVAGLGSAQAFGTSAVTVKGPPQTVVVPGVYPFGYTVTAVSTTGQVVSGDGHLVGGGVASTAAQFGVPTLATGSFSTTTSVGSTPSAAAFGVVTIRAAITRGVTGIGSAQAFGAVTAVNVAGSQTKAVTGVGSAQAFGALTAKPPTQIVQVPGLQQVASWGLSITGQVITGDGHLVLGGGSPLFGQVVIRTTVTTVVSGIPSAQRFGTPWIAFAQKIAVAGLASATRLGRVVVFVVYMRDSTCTDLEPLESVALEMELAEILCGAGAMTPAGSSDLDLTASTPSDLELQEA